MTDERRTAVLVEDEESIAGAIARALRRGFGAEEPSEDTEPAGPIAMPLGDDEAAPVPLQLERAEVAVVLDPASLEVARRASVPKVVVLWPFLSGAWEGELEADLVLVSHEVLVHDAVRAGVSRRRVVVVGPVAPDGWAASEDREALLEARELDGERPVVVVRADALDRDDLAPGLVQLSLVSRDAQWLFDVGRDPELARALRRHVPGYGLDARMFADGEEALACYQAADLVLGRFDGAEAARAFAVGAGLVSMPPRRAQARLAHVVETSRLAAIADAAPTLAVTLDAALAPAALETGRQVAEKLDAANGVARVVAEVRALLRGDRGGGLAAGLPQGLERLDDGDAAPREHTEPDAPEPSAPNEDASDESIDAELDALREKLGL